MRRTILPNFKIFVLPIVLLMSMMVAFRSSAQYCAATNQGGSQIISVSIQGTSLVNTTGSGPAPTFYTAYPATGNTTATLIPGQIYPIDLAFDDQAISSVWIDYNHDFIYDATEWIQVTTSATSGTGMLSVPVTAVAGNTGMRVRTRNANLQNGAGDACLAMGSGETEDYTITIGVATPCGGQPVAGVASAPASVCDGVNFVISTTGFSVGSGISFQWESSPLGAGTWTPIANATNPFYYAIGGQSTPTDYHMIITCANGGSTDITNTVSIDMNAPTLCYCSPLTGTTLHTYPYNSILNVSILSTPLSISSPNTGTGGYTQFDPATPSNTASLEQGVSYVFSADLSDFNNIPGVWIDYDQSGTFDASEFVTMQPSAGPSNTSTGIFTVPLTATPGLTGMRISNYYNPYGSGDACNNYDGETVDFFVTITVAPPCGGTPAPGVAAGPSIMCPSTPFLLSLTGYTTGLGIEVQWEESPSGAGSWTPIAGATMPYFTNPGIAAPTDFRAVVLCTNGGNSDISNEISVDVSPFYICYCSPMSGVSIHNYSNNTINNVTIPGTTLNSSNPSPGYGGFTQPDPSIASNTATLEQGATYMFTASLDNSNDVPGVWIDYDQNGVLDPGEYIPMSPSTGAGNISTGVFTVPLTAVPGLTGLRIRDYYNPYDPTESCLNTDGETEDYVVTINAAVACSGVPVPGTAAGPASICPSSSFLLSLTGNTTGLGIEVQWEESPSGTNTWTPIAGANNPYFTNPGITADMDYRAVVLCTNGGNSDISNTVTVTVSPFYMCYCSPLTGVTLHTYGYNTINNVTIPNTTLNSTNPATTNSGYTQTDPSIPANTAVLEQGVSYVINASLNNSGEEPGLWIDYDQNGTFDAGEFVSMSPSGGAGNISTAIFTVPITATPGMTGLRIRDYYNSFGSGDACYDPYDGETEDYVITINAALPCNGVPVAGTASAPSGVCPSTGFTMSLAGYTTGIGIDLQWEESPAGTNTWTPIAGANSPYYSNPGITADMDYRAVVLCNNGGNSSTSNVVTVVVNPFYLCYCSPLSGVTIHTYYYNYINNVTIPTTTLNSSNPVVGADGYLQLDGSIPSNTALLGQGLSYTLENTLYDAGYTPAAWIDYDQNGIFDASEFISMSASGGANNLSSGLFTVPATAVPGVTGLRVRSYYNTMGSGDACWDPYDGETEDYVVTIYAVTNCNGTPVAGTITGPSGMCSAVSSNLTLTGNTLGNGIGIQWESSPLGAGTWSPIAGATDPVYTATQTVPTDYRVVVSCSNSGLSDISNILSEAINPVTVCYCIPTYINGGTQDYIGNVTLGTLSNTTIGNLYPFYVDYTSQQPATLAIPDMVPGSSYNLSLTFGNDGNQYNGIWIDLNQDGVFDPTEFYTSGTNNQSNGSVATTVTIAIPLTATLGQTRMRIRGGDDQQPDDIQACGATNSNYGETEDYLVNITNSPLAISIRSVAASNVGLRNRVDWTTSTEQKGDYFIVERSANSKDFTKIGEVSAKGQASAYSFWDETPLNGVSYYRLKLMDASDKFTYSRVVSATVKGSASFVVDAYPNPVTDQLTVTAYGQQGSNRTVSVCDVTGKVIRMIEMSGASVNISMGSLAQGMYLIKYSDSKQSQTIKVNKQ